MSAKREVKDLQEIMTQLWPWYVSGPLLGLIVPLLLWLGNKDFGISANLRHVCAMWPGKKPAFFQYDWKKETWNLLFALGLLAGGFLAGYLYPGDPVSLNGTVLERIKSWGLDDPQAIVPVKLFAVSALASWKVWVYLLLGGFLIGFGARYGGGCTSGHAITGIAAWQLPSLVAVVFFFVGGLIGAWWILPGLVAWITGGAG